MKHSRFGEEQIIAVPKQNEANARVDDLCRRQGISAATFYARRKRFRGMETPPLELLSGSALALSVTHNPEIYGYPRP